MKITSYTKTGSKSEAGVTLDAAVFGVSVDHELMGLAYRAYLANSRATSAKVLNRGDVAGGGKKPWRQKGTGRARVGSSRVPNWRGGGVVFGPTGEQNFTITVPTKQKRLALCGALSAQAKDGNIVIIEDLSVKDGKTKEAAALLSKLGVSGSVLLVVAEREPKFTRSTANLAGVKTVTAKYLTVFDLLNADKIVITKPALSVITDWLGQKEAKDA